LDTEVIFRTSVEANLPLKRATELMHLNIFLNGVTMKGMLKSQHLKCKINFSIFQSLASSSWKAWTL